MTLTLPKYPVIGKFEVVSDTEVSLKSTYSCTDEYDDEGDYAGGVTIYLVTPEFNVEYGTWKRDEKNELVSDMPQEYPLGKWVCTHGDNEECFCDGPEANPQYDTLIQAMSEAIEMMTNNFV